MLTFTKKDFSYFIAGFLLVAAGLTLMAIDHAPGGFGIMTLWIAPPVMVTGFILPVIGLSGRAVTIARIFQYQAKDIFGVFVFAVSFGVYLLTLEPTASLWDCSEFIAAAYKLQVPHTPGTPLALLLGRLFTMLSFGDTSKVAWTLNMMSGLFSALTVTLVYHLIYHFAQKIVHHHRNTTAILIASSVTGSLTLAFSDTFWFSAVEAETYGAACFFLILLVLMIVKGREKLEPERSRWLVLIFYVAGLSYSIHPMCVLSLALIPFTWYVTARQLTLKNLTLCVLSGLGIVFALNKFIAIGLFEAAFSFDLFFVNELQMPFYTGAVILALLMLSAFGWGLRSFAKARVYTWSLIFLIVGFLPYLMLFVRSNQDPPIDETNPENLAMIKAYMNRESYPSSPLLYGPYFDAKVESVSVRKQIYYKSDDRYEKAGGMHEYHYGKSRNTFFPRIYSNDANNIETYRAWTGLKPNEKPAFQDNVEFLVKYQLGHMYLRYLMFNFVGRESDVQNSTWLRPWDQRTLAGQELHLVRARNQYWMVPLLLGLAGGFFQFNNDRKRFIQLAIFFLITGLVLALYLNSPPNEPRERDYIYVGSYIAFAIWIGLGILSLFRLVSRFAAGSVAVTCIAFALPLWMLYENFDDHNRAQRTFQIDNARNTLNSCAPNSILFTGGDNDTFPMWYLQDVEGFRTDVRVMVLSYFNTDWYINQLRRKYYNSEPFKLTLTEDAYRQYGPNDVLYLDERIRAPINAEQFLKLINAEHSSLQMVSSTGDPYNILPSRTLNIRVNKTEFIDDHFVKTHLSKDDPSGINLEVSEAYLQKNALAIIDLVVSNHWQRPVYFNFSSMNGLGLDVQPYLVQEGLVYRFVPLTNNEKNIPVDTQRAYDNLVTNADYANLANTHVHFNYEDYHARMIVPLRQSFNSLAVALLYEGDTDKCRAVLEHAIKHLYPKHLQPSYTNLQAAELLMNLDQKDDAEMLAVMLFEFYFPSVKSRLERRLSADDLELYLLENAAALLQRLGKNQYQLKLDSLGLGG
jgi:hypothetical protein